MALHRYLAAAAAHPGDDTLSAVDLLLAVCEPDWVTFEVWQAAKRDLGPARSLTGDAAREALLAASQREVA